ncbi:uncharacterized protein LOC131250832 isoform X4 [Magnolia sinica]|uniref:uncharacterized protein LOC131250832 isoform X4 n=1 Tax=Magnolia sinica TaxID=86752 RepID=UPI00265A3924|nr:uncharacterized protein LOC131250832 isoform X4 [Magnolia sinica]
MEMQLLYSKLHDKYTELKMRKESEIEQYNREQKSKFMNYISAKELSEEVERLRNLLQEKSDSIDKNDDSIDGQLKSPYGGSQLRSRDLSEGSAGLKTLRPCSGVQTEEVMVIPNAGSQEEHVMVKEPERGPGKGMPYSDALGNSQQPCSCRRTMASSGDGLNDVCHGDCHFQTLVECLVGMKFSTVNQTEGLCFCTSPIDWLFFQLNMGEKRSWGGAGVAVSCCLTWDV